MKLISKIKSAYKLGENDRKTDFLLPEYGTNWFINNFMLKEKQKNTFNFLEKRAYDISYHGSLVFIV